MGKHYSRCSTDYRPTKHCIRTVIFTARAYFLSQAYERAEGVLDELIPTIDASTDHVRSLTDANVQRRVFTLI